MIRVNWQIEDGKEDSSLFSCESILFSLPRAPRARPPQPRQDGPTQRRQGLRVVEKPVLISVWAYLRERVMNRTRNRSKNLLIRIGIELFYFSSEAALVVYLLLSGFVKIATMLAYENCIPSPN